MEEINLRQRLVLSVQVRFVDIKQVKFRLEKFEMRLLQMCLSSVSVSRALFRGVFSWV